VNQHHEWDYGTADYPQAGEEGIAFWARNYLLDRKIPARFFYYFTATDTLVPVGGLICFGLTRDQDMVCLEKVDSSVWEVSSRSDGAHSLINSNLDAFLEIMAICEEVISGHERVNDDEQELEEEFIERWIETSNDLRGRIAIIDPPSLFDGSYWSDFLSDVANGDYE
jgi:hypothetical protein